jgi:hypothetical protein
MSLRIMAGATLFALVATDAVAQNAASVSGSYCGTWASGNSWQMTLQQNGTSVSASVTGRRPDGGPSSGSASGKLSGSQIVLNFAFSRGAAGTFSGRVGGGGISAAFVRTEPGNGRTPRALRVAEMTI